MPKISIEGCVGCGKSTVMDVLARRMPDWLVLQEPLERFEEADLAGGISKANYLKEFYDLPQPGTCRRLQTQVIVSLLERYEKLGRQGPGDKMVILERSLQAGRKIFIEHNRHLLSEREYTILTDLCLFGERFFESDLVRIYLLVPDTEMVDRIRSRARPSEDKISFGAMLKIQRAMDTWAHDSGMHIVDTANLSAEEVADKIMKLIV